MNFTTCEWFCAFVEQGCEFKVSEVYHMLNFDIFAIKFNFMPKRKKFQAQPKLAQA